MRRRTYLATCTAGLATIAGCTGGDGGETTETREDTDGDGVRDSEDYAPRDPDVQSASDVATAASTTARPTTTATATATPTTVASTTAVEDDEQTDDSTSGNTLHVDDEFADSESRILSYSSTSVTARIVPDGPSISGLDADRVKLAAVAYGYPRDTGITYSESDPVALSSVTTISTDVDLTSAPTGERLHYLVFVLPADVAFEDADPSTVAFFHETDPFVLRDDRATVERSAHPDALGDDSGDGFERKAVEGAYSLAFKGRTSGTRWQTSFYVYKSAYVAKATASRGRSREEYVTYSMQDGFAGELATILSEEAAANDITGKREKVEFVVDFVQGLPYVADDVSKGFDDYTKFLTETMAEANGDCEDTAIMLAAVLQSEPFGYDMVLIQPPGHMAAGIYGKDDLPGYYWTKDDRKYYYIETTGEGWGIGDLPETYEGESAYVYQV
jgi:hypothetical protein